MRARGLVAARTFWLQWKGVCFWKRGVWEKFLEGEKKNLGETAGAEKRAKAAEAGMLRLAAAAEKAEHERRERNILESRKRKQVDQ